MISSKPAKYFTVSGALAATLVLFACDSGGNQQVHSDRNDVELVLLRFDATKAVFVGELCSLEQRRSDKIAFSIAATPSVAHFTAPALLGSSNALSLGDLRPQFRKNFRQGSRSCDRRGLERAVAQREHPRCAMGKVLER